VLSDFGLLSSQWFATIFLERRSVKPQVEFKLNVLSVGELLWDVFGEQEFLGGAPLNFSVASQRLDNPAIF
jgi:hypothetical protein